MVATPAGVTLFQLIFETLGSFGAFSINRIPISIIRIPIAISIKLHVIWVILIHIVENTIELSIYFHFAFKFNFPGDFGDYAKPNFP